MFNRYVFAAVSASLFFWSGAVMAHHHEGQQGQQAQQAQQGQQVQPGQQFEDEGQQIEITEQRILSLLHHCNGMEIGAAGLVADRGEDQRVKDFALVLLKDHQDADAKVLDLAKRESLDVSAFKAGSEEEQAEMDAQMQALEELKTLQGADFDRAFLTAIISAHQSVLDKLEPAREALADKETGTLIEALIPIIESHRDQAQDLLGQD